MCIDPLRLITNRGNSQTVVKNNRLIDFWCFNNILVFQQYFSYIMATTFSGGRSQSTRREPPTMGKQLVNAPFFVIYKAGRESTPYWREACMSC